MQILNVTGLGEVADYEVAVLINQQRIATGTVTNHRRADGWRALLARVAQMPDSAAIPDEAWEMKAPR